MRLITLPSIFLPGTVQDVGETDQPVLRHEDGLGNAHGLAARALKPAGEPRLLIDDHVADRHQRPHEIGLAARARQHRAEHQPLAVLAIAREGPGAGELDAARNDLDFFAREVRARHQRVRIGPDVALRLEREIRGHPLVTDRQRAAPAGAAAGRAELERDLPQLGRAVLEAAERGRAYQAVDFGVLQQIHRLLRDAALLLGRARGGADRGLHLAHAAEQRREVRAPWLGRQGNRRGQLHGFLHLGL
jgi:hypothetical protein